MECPAAAGTPAHVTSLVAKFVVNLPGDNRWFVFIVADKSRYNVYMMEECHTVLAVGAGAVTKLKNPDANEIERIFNYKYPYEYINGFEEIEKRKDRILSFYRERT